MKKLTTLLIGALVALLALTPVAGANGKRHRARTVTVCGIVDASSTLPSALVLATGGTRKVTIQNSKPVAVPANVVAGADVCARAKRVRNADPAKRRVLLNVRARAAATVQATGSVTVGADRITVATLDFLFKPGFTLSPRITNTRLVRAFGSVAVAGDPIMLKRVAKLRFGHRVHAKKAAKSVAGSALITGRVSDLAAATASAAGSLKVGGIAVASPAGKVLRATVQDGARVTAWATVENGELTLRRVVVTQRAPA
jgi:hypothetical protein